MDYANREAPEVNLNVCYGIEDLQPEFQPEKEEEAIAADRPAAGQVDLFEEVEGIPDTSEEDEASERGSADEGYDLGERDVDCFPGFVFLGTGVGKIHKPATLRPGDTNPACCVRGRLFSCLGLDEAWGESYSLCSRCFGRQGECEKLCEYKTTIKGDLHRCGRRCAGSCRTESEGQVASHACSFHAPVVE